MGCLENVKIRKKEDFKNAIWLENPEDLLYVRESYYGCCSPRYIPKRTVCRLVTENIDMNVPCKLIGYTKPKYIGYRLYQGLFWWLKGYDLGMPYAKYGYGDKSRWKDSNIIIIPSEAVKFVK